MSGFPDNFRDLTAFSGDGLDYSTSSNTAIKMYDALVHQVRDIVNCHVVITVQCNLRPSITTPTPSTRAGPAQSGRCSPLTLSLPWAAS